MDIHTILVPFDFSAYSEKAFAWALAIAEQWGARLRLLHVVPLPTYPLNVLGVHFSVADFEASLQTEAEAQLQAVVNRPGKPAVPIDAQVLRGEPFTDICRMAEQDRTDLIVIGSQGRTGVSHVLLGSVAERVVRYAPCPVLVVGKKARPSQ
jgi:nucleotide-binding universal stress UspA family protein